jgi:hypothetical protein
VGRAVVVVLVPLAIMAILPEVEMGATALHHQLRVHQSHGPVVAGVVRYTVEVVLQYLHKQLAARAAVAMAGLELEETEHQEPLIAAAVVVGQYQSTLEHLERAATVVPVWSLSKCQITLLRPSQVVLRSPLPPLETLRFTP